MYDKANDTYQLLSGDQSARTLAVATKNAEDRVAQAVANGGSKKSPELVVGRLRATLGCGGSQVEYRLSSRMESPTGRYITCPGKYDGILAAMATAQLLTSMLFNVRPHDPTTYVAVAALLGLVAMVATLVPARAAMRVEPVVALRYE